MYPAGGACIRGCNAGLISDIYVHLLKSSNLGYAWLDLTPLPSLRRHHLRLLRLPRRHHRFVRPNQEGLPEPFSLLPRPFCRRFLLQED